ncbi:MAG: amidohydrolase [Gemmatimonadota bacterium]|nr:amidohydrolase [Gemmatimonadota bacterium]
MGHFLPALLIATACTSTEPADLLLHNGKIVTSDERFGLAEALVVRGGYIVAVGGEEIASRYDPAQVIDLEGRTVIPGFIDTHTHIRGRSRRHLELAGVQSIAELQERVRAKAAELGEGEWITGYGWSEDELAEGRRPLRWDLDDAAPLNPVILTRAGGHSAVSNSRALTLAGIDENTPQPEGGVIEHDRNGRLNGVIRERAGLVSRMVPDATEDEIEESLARMLRDQLALGITSLIQAGETPEGYAMWERIYAARGEELPRATVQIRWVGSDRLAAFGRRTGDGDDRLRVGAVKVLVDGGFTGPAAYTREPYKGQPGYRGSLNLPVEELYALVDTANRLGWQLGFHAIGDSAIVLTVDAFAQALAAHPRDDHRHYLNHFTVSPPVGTLDRMAALGIAVAQQPNFTYTLEGRYVANLEGDRLAHNNPLKLPMDRGVFMGLGSDILPIGPLVGVYAAVTRKGMSGEVYGPEERLTMAEAITGYTRHAAWFTFEERTKGSLEPGKLADLVVLSDDLLTIDPERIMDVEVEMTVVGGKVLYRRPDTPRQ